MPAGPAVRAEFATGPGDRTPATRSHGGTRVASWVDMMTSTTIRRVLSVLTLLVASGAAVVFADESTPSTPSTPAPSVVEDSPPAETYTRQILTVDAASIATLVAAGLIDATGPDDTVANGLSMIALGGMLFGGPIVHATHGNMGRTAASLGLRLGLTFVGAGVGFGLAGCDRDEFLCGVGQAAIGSSVGLLTAMAIDAAVLARWRDTDETRPVAPPPLRRPSTTFSFSPSLVATPNLALAGVSGRF